MNGSESAWKAYEAGSFEESITAATEVLQGDPFDSAAFAVRALSRAGLGELDGAIDDMVSAIKYESSTPDFDLLDPIRSPQAKNLRGVPWFEAYRKAFQSIRSEPDVSRDILKRSLALSALAHSPSGDLSGINLNPLYWLAILEAQQGQKEKAFSYLRRCWWDYSDSLVQDLYRELAIIQEDIRSTPHNSPC